MSISKLMSWIEEASKSGQISKEEVSFLEEKAHSFGLSPTLVRESLHAKKIIITDNKESKSSLQALATLNAEVRQNFHVWFDNKDFKRIILYFEKNLPDTYDTVLIRLYIHSLLSSFEPQKALQVLEISSTKKLNDDPELRKLSAEVWFQNERFRLAFPIFMEDSINMSWYLDQIILKTLTANNFDQLRHYRSWKNYYPLLRNHLLNQFKEQKFVAVAELFELDFKDDATLAEIYLESLYNINGRLHDAYDYGIKCLNCLDTSPSLLLLLGKICKSLHRWKESFAFLSQALQHIPKVNLEIEGLFDELIQLEEWAELKKMSSYPGLTDYLDHTFLMAMVRDDHAKILGIFNTFYHTNPSEVQVKLALNSLFSTSPSKGKSFFEKYEFVLPKVDPNTFYLAGRAYELSLDFKTSLDMFQKAENLEPDTYQEDIIRVTYALYPDKQFIALYEQREFEKASQLFELKLKSTGEIKLIQMYIQSLYKKKETKEKALEMGLLYAKSHIEGHTLFEFVAKMQMDFEQYEEAKATLLLAQKYGYEVMEPLLKVQLILNQKEEEKKKQKAIELEKMKEEERLQNEERLRKRLAWEAEEEIKERQRISEERERKYKEEQLKQESLASDQENSKIDKLIEDFGKHTFKSSVSRGGDAIFPEYIYLDAHEVTWEKKSGLFSKDTKSIPMQHITQIDIETALVGSKIKILGKGFGAIVGENFTKSDVKEIKQLIERAQQALK